MNISNPSLPWLESGADFPPLQQAWGQDSVAPGLLCAGGDLSVATLLRAYQHAIFPWFSAHQPVLWWSPDPRMVLQVADFRVHASFKKTLKNFSHATACEIRVDSDFEAVINACASSTRNGQAHTWIVRDMITAYIQFHGAGFAHSIETWRDGQLAGGLYFIAIGQAVFGESMFFRMPNGSKIALAALVCMCRHFGIKQIDCQQNTQHLSSLGAKEIPREKFARDTTLSATEPGPEWKFSPLYWNEIDIQNPVIK